jgi:predicted nucleotidyltransferase
MLVELLSSKVRAGIFTHLFDSIPVELHNRELVRRIGSAESGVRKELHNLVRLDLLVSRKDGNRTYYQANQQHPLYTDIKNMVAKTTGLPALLGRTLQDKGIVLAFIFGSIAGKTERSGSDVDLMVIGDITMQRLIKVLADMPQKMGREINPFILTKSELVKRWQQGEHFITTVIKGPKVFVVGTEHEFKRMVE